MSIGLPLAWALLTAAGFAAEPPPFPPAPALSTDGLPASAIVRPPGAGGDQHPVEVRLFTEPATATPGSVVTLGVQLVQDEHWHTYWRSPGEVGQPTEVVWTLPPGATVAERRWPVPEHFVADGIASYGYDAQVVHLFDVSLPAGLKPGKHPISADVSWLVCKSSCIPGSATVSTTLDVGAAPVPGKNAAVVDAWRARWATPAADVPALTVDVVSCSGADVPEQPLSRAIVVKAAAGHTLAAVDAGPITWPTFAPILSASWMLDAARVVPQADGFVVRVEGTTFAPDPALPPDVFGGLLQVQVDGQWVRAEVATPITWSPAGTERTASTDPVCAIPAKSDVAATPTEPAPGATPDGAPVDAAAVGPAAATGAGLVLWNLLMAFIGGLILNVMPCVLPVLTLKLYGLVEQGGISDADKRQAGLMYTLGILVSFWALAAAVWVTREVLGGSVGWGFQFQYPGYVAGLATLVYLFGLSLFGVFEIPTIGGDSAHELSSREGPAGYFFTGVFATLVATPCSAPFLGTATAFAFQASTPLLVAIFSLVGLGLASPFLFVAFVPAAYKLLPRPGAWMEAFKQLLGFTLVGTTLWLVSVLLAQVGDDATIGFLAFLLCVSVGAWVFGRFGGVAGTLRDQLISGAVGVAIAAVGGWQFLDLEVAPAEACDDSPVSTDLDWTEGIPWQSFSPERVTALSGKTLFLDFTADWCVSCKVNERTVLETETVRDAMREHGVIPLQADWTRKDPVISAWLTRYQRAGVPLYLVIPPSGEAQAIALPEVITPGMVVEAVKAAAGKG